MVKHERSDSLMLDRFVQRVKEIEIHPMESPLRGMTFENKQH